MRTAAVFLIILFLTSCSTTKLSGRMDLKNETYTSPDKEFMVSLPALIHPNVKDTVFPNQLFVDFFIGSGYWIPQGLHTIEWLKLHKEITSEQFQKVLPDLVSVHSEKRFASNGSFEIIEQSRPDDNQSHVFLAKGVYKGVPSTWICTVKWYKNRVAFISKVLPIDNQFPIIKLGENTDGYNRWVETFSVL